MSDTTIDAIITKLRAGKDPDTGELHITEQEAKSALYDLILKEVVPETIDYRGNGSEWNDCVEKVRNKLKGLFE